MGPMNYPAFRIPFVFAIEFYAISYFQWFNPFGQINIVGHQERLPG